MRDRVGSGWNCDAAARPRAYDVIDHSPGVMPHEASEDRDASRTDRFAVRLFHRTAGVVDHLGVRSAVVVVASDVANTAGGNQAAQTRK